MYASSQSSKYKAYSADRPPERPNYRIESLRELSERYSDKRVFEDSTPSLSIQPLSLSFRRYHKASLADRGEESQVLTPEPLPLSRCREFLRWALSEGKAAMNRAGPALQTNQNLCAALSSSSHSNPTNACSRLPELANGHQQC